MSDTTMAAGPYTATSSRYLLAGSVPPRKKPCDSLIAPWNSVAISMPPPGMQEDPVINTEWAIVKIMRRPMGARTAVSANKECL